VQTLSSPTATSVAQALTLGSTWRYVVRASDGAGNLSGWAYGAFEEPLLTQQSSPAIRYGGTWTVGYSTGYSGGSTRYATAAGAWASYTFTGSSIGWVAAVGPGRGSANVYVDGVYQRTFTLAQPRPGWQPLGLAFDSKGDLYVTDLSGPFQKILVIDRAATVVRTLGETSKLSFPNGVAVDGAGNVYVSDSNNGRLLAFAADGTVTAQIGRGAGQGNLGLPRGIAVSGDRVFVADTSAHGVFVYRTLAEGARRLDFLGFIGGQGVTDGLFEYPMSVAPDARGRLYIADTANNRVQVWSY